MRRTAEVMTTGKTILGKKRKVGEIIEGEELDQIPFHILTALQGSNILRVSTMTDSGKEVSLETVIETLGDLTKQIESLEEKVATLSKPTAKPKTTLKKRTTKRSL